MNKKIQNRVFCHVAKPERKLFLTLTSHIAFRTAQRKKNARWKKLNKTLGSMLQRKEAELYSYSNKSKNEKAKTWKIHEPKKLY